MSYIEVSFLCIPSEPWNEIIVANLSELPFESFMEENSYLKAYIKKENFKVSDLNKLVLEWRKNKDLNLKFEITEIAQQNWNEVWESQFEPISVNDDLHLLAPFHPKKNYTGLIIEIEPKMSFGTGHHQTTFSMCEEISKLNLKDKKVLDMGSGTGVLAILAEKLGAKEILAIDIEPWSVENCVENTKRNNCSKIVSVFGDVHKIKNQKFDVVFANINKNVLLAQIPMYSKCLNLSGILLLSGFFVTDVDELILAADNENLIIISSKNKDGWAILNFKKIE